MRKQWNLVVNGSLARFFSRTGMGDPLVALETIGGPEGQPRASEIECDHQGHGRCEASSDTFHLEPHTSERKKVVHQFAHELAQRLEEGLVDGEYESFWLIASSPLLNEIKVCLNRGVAHRLKWTHNADFTGLDAGTLERRLRELWEPRELGMPVH